MLAWMTSLALLSAFQEGRPGSDRRADEPLEIQQMFVPFDQIDKFRDPTVSYQSMGYEAFVELLRAADAVWKSRRFVGPAAGTITGRVDLEERRVFGTSTWSFPKGHSGSVELRPWNLRVLSVREQGRSARPDWGLTSDGALVVRGLPNDAKQIDVDWELPGEAPNRRWTIRGQTPKCASSKIRLDYPGDWEAWATASFEAASLSNETKRIETRSSGDSNWTIELAPAGLIDAERPLTSWRGESSFRFGPVRTDVELRAVVQIDRERSPRVKLRLPATLSKLTLSVVGATANWRRENLPDGGVEWTAEFRRPPLGSVQLVATGSLPTPTGKPWPLESFSVPNALFRGERVDVAVDPALRLLALDPASLVPREYRVEGGVGRWQLVGFPGDHRPTVNFDERRLETEVHGHHFLDVGRDRARLATRFDWTCVRGELSAPTVSVPLGWKFIKGSVEPAARMRSAPFAELNDDGRLRVSIPLTRPLTTGEKLQTDLQFERPTIGWTPASGSSLVLPEIIAVGAASVGPTTYSVRIDSALPLRLSGDDPKWAATAVVAGAPPVGWNWDGDVARFQYAPPLANSFLRGVESQRLVFDADILNIIQERPSDWESRTTFTIFVRTGEVGWVEIESSRRLPPDARWAWNGAEDAADDIQEHPDPKQSGRTRYRLPLRAGADGRAAIQVSWRTKESTIEPIAFRFPEADRTTVRAVVLSAESKRVQVASNGWVEADVDREISEQIDAKNLRWSGRLERAEGTASLRVRRADAASEDAQGGEVHGTVDVVGPPHRRVFHASLRLESTAAAPFALDAPTGVKLWSAALNGQVVSAWVHSTVTGKASINFSEPIPAGRQRLDVVFEADVPAPNEAMTPSIQAPWRAGRILWRIAAADPAWDVISDPRFLGGLRTDSASRVSSLERQADLVGRGKSDEIGFAARRAAKMLRSSPQTAGIDQAEDLADALLVLQRRLPEGWIVVVEKWAADSASRVRASGNSISSVEEWLTSVGLHPTLGANVLLLTGRRLSSAVDAKGSTIEPQAFAESKAESLRANGIEPWGAFSAVSQWRPFDEGFSGEPLIQGGDSTDQRTTLYIRGDGQPLDALASNAETSTSFAIAGFWAGAAAALIGCVVNRRSIRFAALLAVAMLAFLLGASIAQNTGSFLTSFAWGTTLATIVGALFYSSDRVRRPAIAIALFSIAVGRVGAIDDQTALVPFDPVRLDAGLTTVEVPEPLFRRLRSLVDDRATPFLLTSADYRGKIVGDQVEWSATLNLVILAKEPPIKAPIGFIGVDVQSLEAEGKPVGYLAPTATLPLVATLSATPKQTLILKFRTPITTVDQGSMTEFPLPAAAQQSFVIAGFNKAVDLVLTPESRGFSLKSEGREVKIVGARGPSALLQLIWRERTAETTLAKALAAASIRPESKSAAWEMQSHFQWDQASGPHELVFSIPQGLFVRRLEGPGLVRWTTSTSVAGVPQLKASIEPGRGALTIHCWFLPRDQKNFSPPLLFPEGAAVQGVVAISLPEDAGCEVAAGRGVGVLGGPEFRDAWRRATNYQPPEAPSKAFAVTDRDHAIAIQVKSAAEPWRMSQEHALRIAPHGAAASWTAMFRFSSIEPTELAVLSVPVGFKIERVESDSLFQWFRVGGEVMFRFSKPMTGEWTIQAKGRFDFPDKEKERRTAVFKPLTPFVGTAGVCSWSLVGDKGVGIEFVRDPPPSCRVQRTETETRIEGPTDDAETEIRLTRAAGKMFVRQGVLVGRRNGEWDCQGLLELNCEGTHSTPWEVLTPRALGAVEWSAPGLRVLDAGVRDAYRRWLVEPRTTDSEKADRFSLRWRSIPPADQPEATRILETPVMRIPAATSNEIWLMQTSTDRLETTAEGFSSEKIPDWMQAMALGLSNDRTVNVWRTNDPASKITFSVPNQPTPAAPPKVQGWVDVSVARNGRCRGRAVWWVAEAGERIDISLPSGCEVLAHRVNGRSVASVAAGEETLPVRLESRGKPWQVELEWTSPGLALPSVRDAEIGSRLLRLRSPFGFESSPNSVSRAEWFARLLERECDEWLTRASNQGADVEDRSGVAYLHQMALEAAGGQTASVEKIWSAFIDKATAARGEEAALRLTEFSGNVADSTAPWLDPSDVEAVVDHFDYTGAVVLPTAFDAPRHDPSPRRSQFPWWFATTFTLAVALALLFAKKFPEAAA